MAFKYDACVQNNVWANCESKVVSMLGICLPRAETRLEVITTDQRPSDLTRLHSEIVRRVRVLETAQWILVRTVCVCACVCVCVTFWGYQTYINVCFFFDSLFVIVQCNLNVLFSFSSFGCRFSFFFFSKIKSTMQCIVCIAHKWFSLIRDHDKFSYKQNNNTNIYLQSS